MVQAVSDSQARSMTAALVRAGLTSSAAKAVIKDPVLAGQVVDLICSCGEVPDSWFEFTTTGKSIVELRDSNRKLFVDKDNPIWADEEWARTVARPEVWQVRTTPMPGSVGRFPDQQDRLIAGSQVFVASARVLVDFLIQYRMRCGTKPFRRWWGRTCDVLDLGAYVTVNFSFEGITFGTLLDGSRSHSVGLAVCRRPILGVWPSGRLC